MQKHLFSQKEGDKWFKRNHPKKKTNYQEIDQLLPFLKPDDFILEIGCSSGFNLHYIQQKVPTNLYGIDPSSKAITEGLETYKDIDLREGTSDLLPYWNGFFDVVILGFCFYVIDRELLFKTVSEIDRVLKDGGLLMMTDFQSKPVQKRYRDSKELKTFKNDYSQFFTGGNHYSLIHRKFYSHKGVFEKDEDQRVSTSLLIKEKIEDIYRVI
jgi:ubiquinone/menaquinone biosynthesis C-methylase UbiE